ncbi:hypothetical protein ABI_00480 [Asticcacaulis biprosthecium C19]|uniref:Uncharacterized protein n=2 Tax=Asticcacaulis biprosthecium TaxID=76891 RepID=F4QG05_9CAUL|nr:hypothetical protein ABI_00480 [Asticcacaulis biprosthecium C19]
MQDQLFRHRPDQGIWGDCHRTCIANILEIPAADVPHSHQEMSGEEFKAQMDGYLASLGLISLTLWWPKPIDYILGIHRDLNPEISYILSGRTKKGIDHSVLCVGGVIRKNPSLDPDNDLVTPASDQNFQTTYVVPQRPPFISEQDFVDVARSWRRDGILSIEAT